MHLSNTHDECDKKIIYVTGFWWINLNIILLCMEADKKIVNGGLILVLNKLKQTYFKGECTKLQTNLLIDIIQCLVKIIMSTPNVNFKDSLVKGYCAIGRIGSN